MKRYLLIVVAALLTALVAAPALADVQFLYGGQFRARYNAGNNVWDGTDHSGYYGNFAPQTFDTLGKPNLYYNSNDNRNYFDQRLRLYFTFVGSKNLKVVTKFEIGDTKWGDCGDGAGQTGIRAGQNGGGDIGADEVALEVKNVYLEFNIPNTPSTGLVGIQTLTLLDSWIIDDDFSAGVLLTKLDPFRIAIGYIGGQYGAERRLGTGTNAVPSNLNVGLSSDYMAYTNQNLNLDDVFISVDYSCAPWKASIIGFYQDGHGTTNSIDRATLGTPVSFYTGVTDTGFMPVQTNIKSNDLFDLGFNLTYKTDSLLGYVNFAKNFGGVSYLYPVETSRYAKLAGITQTATGASLTPLSTSYSTVSSSDYEGWMIDAGITYFCPPWSFNVGGFYTTGPNFSSTVGQNGSGVNPLYSTANSALNHPSTSPVESTGGLPFRGTTDSNVTWFTGPVGTSKYSSEILGGGVLADDQWVQRGFANGLAASKLNFTGYSALSTIYWETYQYPTNVWTLTAGAAWQLCPGTRVSASYWYWGTSNPVPVAFSQSSIQAAGLPVKGNLNAKEANSLSYGNLANQLQYDMSSSIGHEIDFYVDQQVVDNLTLTLVAAYLFADDAFCPLPVPAYGPSTPTGQTTVTTANGAFGNAYNQINPNKYMTPAVSDAFKLGARLQWNF